MNLAEMLGIIADAIADAMAIGIVVIVRALPAYTPYKDAVSDSLKPLMPIMKK
jgi:hypothetical protein